MSGWPRELEAGSQLNQVVEESQLLHIKSLRQKKLPNNLHADLEEEDQNTANDRVS